MFGLNTEFTKATRLVNNGAFMDTWYKTEDPYTVIETKAGGKRKY